MPLKWHQDDPSIGLLESCRHAQHYENSLARSLNPFIEAKIIPIPFSASFLTAIDLVGDVGAQSHPLQMEVGGTGLCKFDVPSLRGAFILELKILDVNDLPVRAFLGKDQCVTPLWASCHPRANEV